jgi:hypothetical protein
VEVLPEGMPIEPKTDFAVLAELISKPNLFSPLYRNLALPLRPFVEQGRFCPASEFIIAARALLDVFQGSLADYLDYRLGSQKAGQALLELEDLLSISQSVAERGLAMRFTPQIIVHDEPLPYS